MESSSKISFGFSKKLSQSKALEKSAIGEVISENSNLTDYVTEVSDKKLKGSLPEPEKKGPLVIPCRTVNDWTFSKIPKVKRENDSSKGEKEKRMEATNGNDIEDEAVKELIEQAKIENEEWEDRTERRGIENLQVPLLMQNRVPEGFEEDEGPLNVELRPVESTLDDYEQVPIEQYGLAMLRGMGWKKGDGIGKTRKGVADVLEAAPRPKGLGLGADRSVVRKEKTKKLKPGDVRSEEDDLSFKTGAHVVCLGGRHKDLYGKIEGVDEDNSRVVVKLAISGQIVTVPQAVAKLVVKSEFEKFSKYLNKGSFDAFKAAKEDSERRNGSEETRKRRSDDDDGHAPAEKKNKDYGTNGDHGESRTNGSTEADSELGLASLWPQLRVRVVSRSLKGGKYYCSKVTIEDVTTPTTCVCRTDDDRVLEDVRRSDLESVVPKKDGAFVRVIRGQKRGRLAEMVKRDKKRCTAVVRLLNDDEDESIFQLSYDDVCEFVGNVQ